MVVLAAAQERGDRGDETRGDREDERVDEGRVERPRDEVREEAVARQLLGLPGGSCASVFGPSKVAIGL